MEKVDVLVGFLAFPSDVPKYKEVAKKAFYEWNIQNGLNNKVFLLPINWTDNARPASGNSPQELINKQLLNRCDFLVGIFWQRLGTPTESAESGTVDEINNFIAKGKTCMIYFSEEKTNPNSIDHGEFKRLTEFKKRISANALFEKVKSPSDFRIKLLNHLTSLVNEYKQNYKIGEVAIPMSRSNAQETAVREPRDIKASELSAESRRLLIATCADKGAYIMNNKYIGTQVISAGDLSIELDYSEAREIVKWEEAIDQLLDNKLIKPYGNGEDMFTPTSKGYALGELLLKETDHI